MNIEEIKHTLQVKRDAAIAEADWNREALIAIQLLEKKIEQLKKQFNGVTEYLIAAAGGSMSRNNSEQLAAELLEQIKGKA